MALFALASCQRQPQQSVPPTVNKFFDNNIQQIHTLQDERNTSQLLPFLQHPQAKYRQEAAIAFASVQDTVAIPQLLSLFADTTTSVRYAAAYALGQAGSSKAESAIIAQLQKERRPKVQAELLEALGKVADSTGLSFLASYQAPNSTALAGQAWGLYRAALRQQVNTQGLQRGVTILASDAPYEARLAAAHFLARAPKADLTPYRQQLITVATSDEAAEVRMATVQALSKIRAIDKANFLTGIVKSDPDYRVRLSAIRAMAGQEFSQMQDAILAGLQDGNINTAIATAEFLQANPIGASLGVLQQALQEAQDARVRGNLIWVILRNSERKEFLSNRYKQLYQNAPYTYDKAHLLKALSGDFANCSFIADEMFAAQEPVISTTGMDALIIMRQLPNFPKDLEQEFADIFKKAVGSGDVALVGMAASAMRDPRLNLRSMYNDFSFLTDAQQKLILPRDMETNIELQKAIDFLRGTPATETPQNPFTHPIDWALVKTIPVNQQVLIRTVKGDITLQLFVEDAPGTVANFVELINKDFFGGLYFHRVVPNFVAQGGDKRGDGWGSSDYSIRSEFAPLRYREGYLGMASAGKDTESNQWFITHSPTPHLDGRYSIFAKVINGINVVHQLEVGDKILSVELQ
ncbi:peptidylprolyl isomerase [Pontibacter silvestris]|uniref:peptidylprolyl isomerase n=2 Tax=Pontibacter silvestris TaxID=2305183 RepID=A0ABW4WVQ9_9BACT|nr:peptidylprolyl isomerase [Pontibacter silvestris]MCC9138120.1 peptidylprolyl isomerase [Pontibacter silvestris]